MARSILMTLEFNMTVRKVSLALYSLIANPLLYQWSKPHIFKLIPHQ